jgi:heme/copper-type cytochrome/quinol oxidase subunit 2
MASLLDQINAQIDELQSENQKVEGEVDDEIKKQRAADQSRIAWVIIWAFVIAIGSIFLFVFGQLLIGSCEEGQADCDPKQWEEPATFLLGIVSSVLLPVVTLVLGYYFGKEKTE